RSTRQRQQVELHEAVALALEEPRDAAPGLQALADVTEPEVSPLALHVDPGTHDHVAAERAVGFLQIQPRVDERPRSGVEGEALTHALAKRPRRIGLDRELRRAEDRDRLQHLPTDSWPLRGQGRGW